MFYTIVYTRLRTRIIFLITLIYIYVVLDYTYLNKMIGVHAYITVIIKLNMLTPVLYRVVVLPHCCDHSAHCQLPLLQVAPGHQQVCEYCRESSRIPLTKAAG
jgi:hypothetical protein